MIRSDSLWNCIIFLNLPPWSKVISKSCQLQRDTPQFLITTQLFLGYMKLPISTAAKGIPNCKKTISNGAIRKLQQPPFRSLKMIPPTWPSDFSMDFQTNSSYKFRFCPFPPTKQEVWTMFDLMIFHHPYPHSSIPFESLSESSLSLTAPSLRRHGCDLVQ